MDTPKQETDLDTKPTGEWTESSVSDMSFGESPFKRIADAHNAELAAEREKLAAAQSGNKAAKAFMDYLRANTGVSDEWPIELKVAEDSIEPINTLLNQFEKSIYATDTDALDAYVEQQLAAEREDFQRQLFAYKELYEPLAKELAAERERT